MTTFLWWLSLAFTFYFGAGIAIGLKKNLKIAQWAIIAFIASLTFCLVM